MDCKHQSQGKSAILLAARLPFVPSTKFGYGTDRLTFTLAKDFAVRLECNRNGTFSLEDLHLLDNLGPDQAEALVRCLDAWRKAWIDVR